MNSFDIEAFFLAGLADHGIAGIAKERAEDGSLVVSVDSPCDAVGFIRARITPHEITLSCKLTHTHADSGYFQRHGSSDPQREMIEEALGIFADFVNGKLLVVEETGADGKPVSNGWRRASEPKHHNPAYRALIEQQHGGPSTFTLWSRVGQVTPGAR